MLIFRCSFRAISVDVGKLDFVVGDRDSLNEQTDDLAASSRRHLCEFALAGDLIVFIEHRLRGFRQIHRTQVFALHVGNEALSAAQQFILGFPNEHLYFPQPGELRRADATVAGQNAIPITVHRHGDGFN